MKKVFTILFLFIGLMIQAQTTYYIDPSGSNSNSGSSGSPWLTLTFACAHTTSGSIIHINAGTYTETSACNLAVGVSIEGDSKTTSIIRSSIGTSSRTYTILLSSSNSNTNGAQHISNIRLESSNAYSAYAAIGVFKRGNVEIYNCDIVNFREYGIVLHNGEQSGVYASGNRIHDCVITNSGMYVGTYNAADGDSRGSIDIISQSDLLIYNNVVTVNRPDGRNGNCIDGVTGYLKNVKIYDNTLHKTFVPGTTWDFAIEFWNVEGGLEIYNNDIIGSIDICISPNKGTSSYVAWLHDNTLGQNALMASESTRGIDLEYNNNDIIIERNYIKNTAVGINNNLDRAGLVQKNIRIDYNILYNIGEAGTDYKGWGIKYSFPDNRFNNVVNNLKIRNNVIVGGGAGSGSTMYGIGLPDVGTATNVEVKNNIVINFDHYSVYANGRGGTTISGLSLENNIFYGNGQNEAIYAEGMSPQGTTQNNYAVNPLFVSSTDFHLQAGSPAINNGIYITSGLTDKDGVTVSNPPEIGAYEFITGDNRPPSIQDQGFQMNENSPVGTAVGTVVAKDSDSGQTLTYSIVSGNTNGAFGIDPLTGLLSVANGVALTGDFSLIVKVQDNGDGELSSQAIVAIDVILTGIELIGNNVTIRVYPNPVSDELFIELIGTNNRQNFSILNSIGQIVFRGNLAEKTVVQTTNFSPGIYLMKIENSKSFELMKIVKV